MLKELNEKNFKDNIQSGLKLVEFYAPWCGYCQKQFPILEELKDIWIGTVNSDENPILAQEYKIEAFPTFILFKNNKIISQFAGYHDKSQLLTKLMENLG